MTNQNGFKRFLEDRQIEQQQMAGMLGMSETQISLQVNGKRRPSYRLRYRFALRYGLHQAEQVFGPGADDTDIAIAACKA